MEEKALITTEELNPEKVFTSVELRVAIVEKIRERASEHVADVSTATGRKAVASNARKVASSKTWIDSIGKDKVAKIKIQAKEIDAGRKYIRDELDIIRDESRQPLTDWETADKIRVDEKVAAIQYEKDWVEAHGQNDLLNRELAVAEKEAELKRIQDESDAKAKADQDEKNRAEREKKIADDAASKATADAERRADEKEKARVAKENAEKAAADAKAADRESQAIKNRAAKASFMKIGFSSEDSEKAVRAIASNQIDNVYISY